MSWSVEQVLAMAPDAGSAKAGRELGQSRKWSELGSDGSGVWGAVQGSGKEPYRTGIDLSEPAFKCSCPSRKFPCKHGLGLFLILVQEPTGIPSGTPPPWVAEWMAKRSEKAIRKQSPSEARSGEPDPERAAKAAESIARRAQQRESRMTEGIAELRQWISDVVRSGLATLPGRPPTFWERPTARLVDAQLPGIARRLAQLESEVGRSPDWAARILSEFALLHLAAEGWGRRAELPEAEYQDLLALAGVPVPQETVLAGEAVEDDWLVLGRRILEEDRVRSQRTWLWGLRSARPALCLSFSATAAQPLDLSLVPGTTVSGSLAFFPGVASVRAVVKSRNGTPNSAGSPALPLPHANLEEALSFAGRTWAGNPWIERLPLALAAVVPGRRGHGWGVADPTGDWLPMEAPAERLWSLLALSGGRPLGLSAEWDGRTLHPLGAWTGTRTWFP